MVWLTNLSMNKKESFQETSKDSNSFNNILEHMIRTMLYSFLKDLESSEVRIASKETNVILFLRLIQNKKMNSIEMDETTGVIHVKNYDKKLHCINIGFRFK